jgi:hypothetical protein
MVKEVAGYSLYSPNSADESKLVNGYGIKTYYLNRGDVIMTISGPLDLDSVAQLVSSLRKASLQTLKAKIE